MATRPRSAAIEESSLPDPVRSTGGQSARKAQDRPAGALPTPLQSITLDLQECRTMLDPDQAGCRVHQVLCPQAVAVIPDPNGRFWWLCFDRLPDGSIDLEFIISQPCAPAVMQRIAAELEPDPSIPDSTAPIGTIAEIDRLITQDELQRACTGEIPQGSEIQLLSKDQRVQVRDNGNGSWTLQINHAADVTQVGMRLLVQEPDGDRYELAACLERAPSAMAQSTFPQNNEDVSVRLFRDPGRLLKVRKGRLQRRKSAGAKAFRYDIDLKWSCGADRHWVETVTVDSADLPAPAPPGD